MKKTTLMLSAMLLISVIKTDYVLSDTTYVTESPIVSKTWTIEGSPYVVERDILVAGLTINPGVSVLFAGNYELEVQGVIEAIGTEQQQIIFTTKSGVTSWKGIRFQNSNPGSYMKWCIVEKANTSGIRIIGSLPTLNKCTIRNNQNTSSHGGGLVINNSMPGDLTIIDCNISNNSVNGFWVGGAYVISNIGTVKFVNCKIENNLANLTTGGTIGGGGAHVEGNVQFIGCLILTNRVTTSSCGATLCYAEGRGGGVYIQNGNIIFSNTIINSNKATGFSGGQGKAYGGGIFIESGTSTFTNCIVSNDTIQSNSSSSRAGAGIYNSGGQTKIVNTTVINNNQDGIYGSTNNGIINSIFFFNGSTQIVSGSNVTYSCVQGGYTGVGNISTAPILDACNRVVTGSLCIDAGKDSVIYRDACFPPSLGGLRNDMGAHGGPGGCNWVGNPESTCCPTKLPIKMELSALMEGLYNPGSNMMVNPQVERMYLRNSSAPFAIVEPAAETIDQFGNSGEFIFNNSASGTYYLVIKNWNCLETWSKSGGEVLYNDGELYTYDFTNSSCQAYGCNQKQIDTSPLRYGIYSGDVTQSGSIDLADILQINTASNQFTSGYNVNDLNGDNLVTLTDVLIAYNNSAAFVSVIKP